MYVHVRALLQANIYAISDILVESSDRARAFEIFIRTTCTVRHQRAANISTREVSIVVGAEKLEGLNGARGGEPMAMQDTCKVHRTRAFSSSAR